MAVAVQEMQHIVLVREFLVGKLLDELFDSGGLDFLPSALAFGVRDLLALLLRRRGVDCLAATYAAAIFRGTL